MMKFKQNKGDFGEITIIIKIKGLKVQKRKKRHHKKRFEEDIEKLEGDKKAIKVTEFITVGDCNNDGCFWK